MRYPFLLKFIPSILLLTIGFLYGNGLLVELSVSWLLLLLFEKKDLSILGIIPTWERTINLLIGFSIAASVCALYYYLQKLFSGSLWLTNTSFTFHKFLSGSLWTMQSVLYEELIFRGALLYIAIKKIGATKACILSAVCFGIYHWFSMGAFGNWVLMTYLFIGTGIMGYIFALAYAKTGSMYLPIGLHFGWNLINNIIFSHGPNGNQWLILKKGEFLNMTESIMVMLVQLVVFPLVAFLYIKMLNPNEPFSSTKTISERKGL